MSNEEVVLPLAWVGLDEVTIQFANQFASQFMGSEFVITVGQVSPPLLVGTPEEMRKQLQTVGFAPVHPIARFGVTPQRMRELIELLKTNLSMFEKTQKDSKS